MKLSSRTFLSNNFIVKIVFLSLVHPVEKLIKDQEKEWSFTMGYMNHNGELKAFELKFDNEEEAKQAREEIAEEITKYEYWF